VDTTFDVACRPAGAQRDHGKETRASIKGAGLPTSRSCAAAACACPGTHGDPKDDCRGGRSSADLPADQPHAIARRQSV